MIILMAIKVDLDFFYWVFCCCLLVFLLCFYVIRVAQVDEFFGEDYEEIYDEGGMQDIYLDNSEFQDEVNGDEIELILDLDQVEMVCEVKVFCIQWVLEFGFDEEDK